MRYDPKIGATIAERATKKALAELYPTLLDWTTEMAERLLKEGGDPEFVSVVIAGEIEERLTRTNVQEISAWRRR